MLLSVLSILFAVLSQLQRNSQCDTWGADSSHSRTGCNTLQSGWNIQTCEVDLLPPSAGWKKEEVADKESTFIFYLITRRHILGSTCFHINKRSGVAWVCVGNLEPKNCNFSQSIFWSHWRCKHLFVPWCVHRLQSDHFTLHTVHKHRCPFCCVTK